MHLDVAGGYIRRREGNGGNGGEKERCQLDDQPFVREKRPALCLVIHLSNRFWFL